jgi:Domain of unknown function (DUF4126)
MESSWTMLGGIALGIGLAAATGLRVFLPLLIAGLAAHFGYIPLSENFQWLASIPALVMLGTAAVAEILAYYVPGVDHALDVMASPATLVAGAIASAAVMTDLPPGVLWPLAIIGGSGIAGLTKGSSALIRAKSGLMTGGLGNPVVSTAETIGATGLSLFAIALPVVALMLIVVLLAWVVRRTGRFFSGRRRADAVATPRER